VSLQPAKAALMFIRLRETGVDVPDALINQLVGFLGFYRGNEQDVYCVKTYSDAVSVVVICINCDVGTSLTT